MAYRRSLFWNRCRARIEHEDNLLNQRTNIFLVANGLGAVAANLSSESNPNIIVVIVALIANFFWIWCGVQTLSAIYSLTSWYMKNAHDEIDKRVRKSLHWSPRRMRSSFILGLYLPIVVTFAWLVALIKLLS